VRTARTLAASLLALAITSCSSPGEEPLLSQFFAASRLRDRTALQDLASVSFEPNVQGVITNFDVTHVAPGAAAGGERESKDVSISAPVRLPDGQTVQKRFVVTMTRSRMAGNTNHWGGWMITAIKDASASPSTPRS
jgi:hypothetical protein